MFLGVFFTYQAIVFVRQEEHYWAFYYALNAVFVILLLVYLALVSEDCNNDVQGCQQVIFNNKKRITDLKKSFYFVSKELCMQQ
jgi:hypothetical protein